MEENSFYKIKEILDGCIYEDFIKIKEELKEDKRKNVQQLLKKYERHYQNLDKLEQDYIKRNKYESNLIKEGYSYIAGIDEVGRGPLAGPVYAAAVILDSRKPIYGIKDSKKLSKEKREELSKKIKEESICYSIAYATVFEIDKYNILNATKLAMKRAINGLRVKPQHILIDALKLEEVSIEQTAIIKGDDISVSIGAASIIAKVERDKYMEEISLEYPQYLFEKNKGYGTSEHILAIKELGICEMHRKTFVKNFVNVD